MKFSEKYPGVEMFQEPMQCIYVAPDYYPCRECQAPTRFIDYMDWRGPRPICSEECAFEAIRAP